MSQNKNAPLSNMHPVLFVALVLVGVFFLYQIASAVLVATLVGVDLSYDEENVGMIRIITTFAQFMFLLIPSVIFTYLRGDTLKSGFKLNKPPLKLLLLSIVAIVLLQPSMQAYIVVQNKLLFSLPFGTEYLQTLKDFLELLESVTLNLVAAHSFPEFLLVVFVIAVTPAICEESLFRGLVFKNMLEFATPYRAVAVTGIIFALFHFHPFNFIPLVVVGIFLTYITLASNSIYPAIVCHFVNNFLAVVSVYIFGKENFNDYNTSMNETLILAATGVVCGVIFLFLMKYISADHQKRVTEKLKNLNAE